MAYICVFWLYFVVFFQTLELANNNIRSMDGLQGHKYLEVIDLEENEVGETFVIKDIKELTYLRTNKFIL